MRSEGFASGSVKIPLTVDKRSLWQGGRSPGKFPDQEILPDEQGRLCGDLDEWSERAYAGGCLGPSRVGTRAGKLASGGSYDTEREPDSPCRVPSDDVAHEMNAQADPAEPDEQNEACKERNRRPAWKMGKGDT
jgi:hypothetical protein